MLRIDGELASRFPGLRVLEFSLEKLVTTHSNPELEALKLEVAHKIQGKIPSLDEVKKLPVVRAYRDFYWKVGIDPTKTRPAGEALVRRMLSGKGLPTINCFVDSYNLASAETLIAIAAFDLGTITPETLRMRKAKAGERFLGLGMSVATELTGLEIVIENETNRELIAIYPYRDSKATAVTESSTAVLLMICGVPGISDAELEHAKTKVLEYVPRFCGGQLRTDSAAV